MRDVLADTCEAWQRRSGRRIAVQAVGGVAALRRLQAGEAFDFVVLAADAIAHLAGEARVDAASVTDLARSAIVVAVRAGAPHPDVSSEAAVRAALRAARAVGCPTGPSGRHVRSLVERWSQDDATAPQLVQAPPGVPVATSSRAATSTSASSRRASSCMRLASTSSDRCRRKSRRSRVFGRGLHRVAAPCRRRRPARLPRIGRVRCGEAPPRHGADARRP